MKKITMQLLAESLELSRVTVWKVLNNRPGVAPETAQKVLDAVEKLQDQDAYVDNEVTEKKLSSSRKNISLIVSRASTSYFWMRIVDQIAAELNNKQISLNYIPLDIMTTDAEQLQELLRPEKTEGLIALNIYSREFLEAFAKFNMPKVFFDSIPGFDAEYLKGDLILLEGENTVEKITDSLISKGCKRIGFIGGIDYAQTNFFRWKGFLNSIEKNGLTFYEDLCLTKFQHVDTYYKVIQEFLDGIDKLPDAFVCANDFVAFTTYNVLHNKRCQIPQDLLLSGYDDSKEFLLDKSGVTTVHVQKGYLGTRLVSQILYRYENPCADFEEIKIHPKIIYRN